MRSITRRNLADSRLHSERTLHDFFAANGIDDVLRRGREERKIPAVVAMTGTADRITYTLGFLMNPDAVPGARSAGSLGKGGINNTYY